MTGKSQSQWSKAFTEYEDTASDRAGACETDPGGNADGLNGAASDPEHAGNAAPKPRMTMLDFYINRSQLCLSARERAAIAKAKAALRARLDEQSDDKTE